MVDELKAEIYHLQCELDSIRVKNRHLENELKVSIQERDGTRALYLNEYTRLSDSLHKTERFTEQLLNAVMYPIYVKNSKLQYILVNDAFCDFIKMDRQDIIGKTSRSLYSLDVAEEYSEIDRRLLDDGISYNRVHDMYIGGNKFIVNSRKIRMKDIQTNDYIILGVFVDITESKRLELEIIKAKDDAVAANKAKTEFLANMSHELRSPISIIFGMVQLLEITELDDTQRFYISEMTKSCDQLMSLITDILDLTKIESGRLDIDENILNIRGLMKELKTQYEPYSTKKRVPIYYRIGNDVADTIVTDPVRLKQILHNLIGNSIKFTKSGEIWVEVSTNNESDTSVDLQFSVIDTGIGISPDSQGKIFEKFVQADTSLQKSFPGAGLGLAIARRLVELLGGHLWVESTVGLYSAFHFNIIVKKVTNEYQLLINNNSRACSIDGKTRILLAEDNDIGRLIVTELLKNAGYEADSVSNGKEALLLLMERNYYDLIIMDIQMPIMDGIQAITKIRSGTLQNVNKDIPIIALTAYAMIGDKNTIFDAGATDYISKPFKKEALLQLIEQVLSQTYKLYRKG